MQAEIDSVAEEVPDHLQHRHAPSECGSEATTVPDVPTIVAPKGKGRAKASPGPPIISDVAQELKLAGRMTAKETAPVLAARNAQNVEVLGGHIVALQVALHFLVQETTAELQGLHAAMAGADAGGAAAYETALTEMRDRLQGLDSSFVVAMEGLAMQTAHNLTIKTEFTTLHGEMRCLSEMFDHATPIALTEHATSRIDQLRLNYDNLISATHSEFASVHNEDQLLRLAAQELNRMVVGLRADIGTLKGRIAAQFIANDGGLAAMQATITRLKADVVRLTTNEGAALTTTAPTTSHNRSWIASGYKRPAEDDIAPAPKRTAGSGLTPVPVRRAAMGYWAHLGPVPADGFPTTVLQQLLRACIPGHQIADCFVERLIGTNNMLAVSFPDFAACQGFINAWNAHNVQALRHVSAAWPIPPVVRTGRSRGRPGRGRVYAGRGFRGQRGGYQRGGAAGGNMASESGAGIDASGNGSMTGGSGSGSGLSSTNGNAVASGSGSGGGVNEADITWLAGGRQNF